jgi:predicted RND superfamily exporter protein
VPGAHRLLGSVAALKLTLNASFEKMIPQRHPYIQNYLENKAELRGLGNALRVVVANKSGDIYDPAYLDTLRKISDELVLTPGVDRAWVKSLWTPGVRWTEVTEEGFRGGPVMPDNYDGSAESIEQLRGNIARAGIVGSLVGTDFRSSMLVVPLLDHDPTTGQRLDYRVLSQQIEDIRTRFEAGEPGQKATVQVHVIGFAKLVGDLIEGLIRSRCSSSSPR